MDGVRTSKRLGAEHAYLIYRRSRTEMPARLEEVHHAEEEGIEFMMLTNPTRIIGDANGRVSGIECQKMELGETDELGYNAVKDVVAVHDLHATLLYLLGIDHQRMTYRYQGRDFRLTDVAGNVVTRTRPPASGPRTSQRTSRDGIFAGGDLSRGGATVILAMRDGKIAAENIHKYLQQKAH